MFGQAALGIGCSVGWCSVGRHCSCSFGVWHLVSGSVQCVIGMERGKDGLVESAVQLVMVVKLVLSVGVSGVQKADIGSGNVIIV